ncbi:MAG: site-specific integrase [Acidobacteria bacterium]|nr:site-specific integrase [Acidobacteriota bacterium]
MEKSQTKETKAKRSSPRYWVEIKGKLYARLQYKAEDGKYKVKYKPLTDKRTARSVVEAMRQELETHGEEILTSDKMTFDDLADKYEEVELVEATYQNGVKIKGRRSVAGIKSAVKPLRTFFGKKLIRSIKTGDITAYKNARLNTPVETEVNEKTKIVDEKTGKKKTLIKKVMRTRERKVATVNRELAWLRAILNFAVSNDWLVKNPFTKMKGVISMSAEVERDRILSFDEEARLLAQCTNERAHLKPILVCALDTAMRRGEIFKMRWCDVSFNANEIHIPQTNTKTEDARTVGMTPRLKEELELLWTVSPQDTNRLVFGITNTVKRAWATACNLAEVEDFRLHDCRHTATTRMIASGSPHTEVMKITGHSHLKTFLRYLNITSETANNVATKLSNYLAGRNQVGITEITKIRI